MTNTYLYCRVLLGAFPILLLSHHQALAHSDVFLANVSGQVAVGGAEDLDGAEGGPFFDLETRVFEGVMLPLGTPPFGFDYERDEPGFFASSSSEAPGSVPLPGNAAASVASATVTFAGGSGSLFYWDGTGAVDFQPTASAQMVFDDAQFGSTGPAGGMDDHPLFGIDGPGIPANGVYLAPLTVAVAGLAESDPFYIVWLVDSVLADEDDAEALEALLEEYEEGGSEPVFAAKNFAFFEEAVEYVDGQLAVPEPSSACIALVGIACGVIGRRRRLG